MNILQGIALGAIQGLGEFLPISSSGHLTLAQKLFNLEEVPFLFDVFLHLATLLVVIIFFRKTIWELLKAFGRLITRRPAPTKGLDESGKTVELSLEDAKVQELNRRKYILAIIITTAITGVLGIVSEKLIGDLPINFVFCGFILTAILLIVSAILDKKSKANKSNESVLDNSSIAPTWIQSIIIGIAQGIGTLPGISRSGSTIAGALLSGVSREAAGKFSFIASIPAILGAFILEAKDLGEVSTAIGFGPLIAGCITAFVTGYLALFLLMKIIKKGHLEWFACYLIPVAILGFIFIH